LNLEADKINLNAAMPRSDLFCSFAASFVERFDLIATTRKNAKPMPFFLPFQSTTSHTNSLLTN
jgi:hypothetical protein